MRVFVTGATGFIGSAVVRELLDAGDDVLGLARSDASARSLLAAGAQVQLGDLEDLSALGSGVEGADGVIHLAFFHGISHPSFGTRLRILLGGSPRRIGSRFGRIAADADGRAIETFGSVLAGSGRPLVVAFPTMALRPSHLATEDDAPDPNSPGSARIPSEARTLALAERGVRSSVVRIAPSVHGDDDAGLVPQLIQTARKKNVSAYVGDGTNRWPAVHRLDAAHLFRLALEGAPAGSRLHAVAEEGVPFRAIAETVGRHLHLPVESITPEKAADHFGFLGAFVANDNPVSSTRTRELLGWQPTQPILIADLDQGRYFDDRAAS